MTETNEDGSLFSYQAELEEPTQVVASCLDTKEGCLPGENEIRIRYFCAVIVCMLVIEEGPTQAQFRVHSEVWATQPVGLYGRQNCEIVETGRAFFCWWGG